MTDAREVENDVKSIVASHLDRTADEFRRCNLKPGEVVLAVMEEAEDQRNSEIRIYFYRDGRIADALEFALYKKGKLVATVDEISNWLSNSLADVVERATTSR